MAFSVRPGPGFCGLEEVYRRGRFRPNRPPNRSALAICRLVAEIVRLFNIRGLASGRRDLGRVKGISMTLRCVAALAGLVTFTLVAPAAAQVPMMGNLPTFDSAPAAPPPGTGAPPPT